MTVAIKDFMTIWNQVVNSSGAETLKSLLSTSQTAHNGLDILRSQTSHHKTIWSFLDGTTPYSFDNFQYEKDLIKDWHSSNFKQMHSKRETPLRKF